jgi:hypothetical protein
MGEGPFKVRLPLAVIAVVEVGAVVAPVAIPIAPATVEAVDNPYDAAMM